MKSLIGLLRLPFSILVQLVIAAVIGGVIFLLIEKAFEAFMAGAVIWTVVFCYTGMFSSWFIAPKANTAIVLANILRKEKRVNVTNNTITEMVRPSRTMRALIGPTLDGKMPWEEVVDGKAISLIPVPLTGILVVYTIDRVECTIHWSMNIKAIQTEWGIINIVRNGEAKIKNVFTTGCEAFIQSETRGITADELLVAIKSNTATNVPVNQGSGALNDRFAKLYDGDDKYHKVEVENGMSTFGLTISKVIFDLKYQKAKQGKVIATANAEALGVYTAKGVNADVAAAMVANANGEPVPVQVTKHIFEGMPAGGHFIFDSNSDGGRK